jgi:hypothetical protein
VPVFISIPFQVQMLLPPVVVPIVEIQTDSQEKETLRHFQTEPKKKGISSILENPGRNTVATEIFGLDASSSAAI